MRDACLKAIGHHIETDPRTVYIGSDLGPETMLEHRQKFPDRCFMDGISEQNIVGMATGLALEGHIVYIHTIANFFCRRAYEQIALGPCLHDLQVRLVLNGVGLIYSALGPTHLAIDWLSLMLTLPKMAVFAPMDSADVTGVIENNHTRNGPWCIGLSMDPR